VTVMNTSLLNIVIICELPANLRAGHVGVTDAPFVKSSHKDSEFQRNRKPKDRATFHFLFNIASANCLMSAVKRTWR
jgi:hypothetical protein